MGTVLGSGYSQVPLAPESAALATLATRATKEIKAQWCERENTIMKERKEGDANYGRKVGEILDTHQNQISRNVRLK